MLMLKGSLYQIHKCDDQDGVIKAVLQVDIHHDIFKGHFPGQPVLPGACMLQMVREVLEDTLSRKLTLKKADNLKFLQVIDPTANNILDLALNYSITEDGVRSNATLSCGGTACFKFQGTFV